MEYLKLFGITFTASLASGIFLFYLSWLRKRLRIETINVGGPKHKIDRILTITFLTPVPAQLSEILIFRLSGLGWGEVDRFRKDAHDIYNRARRIIN